MDQRTQLITNNAIQNDLISCFIQSIQDNNSFNLSKFII
ncbi:hypothetical protein ENHYDAX1_270080 [Enhydrobacter sp. AX1]|nr:hypothetical protein ENHYDAX1_270080 [Enhydrobacter sp. AX1]